MLWFSILNKSSDWTFSCFQSVWGKDWVWSRTAAGQGMGSRAGKWCGRQVGWLCGGSCRGWRGHFGYVPLALLSSVCLNSIQLYFLNPIWFCKFSIQVSQWRAHPRLRLNVMIRETAPVTWGTGPQNRAEYAVHVLCKNEDIQLSPFMAEIVPAPGKDFYPDKVINLPTLIFVKNYS